MSAFRIKFINIFYLLIIFTYFPSCGEFRNKKIQKREISLEILGKIGEAIKNYHLEYNENPKDLNDLEPLFYSSATGKIEDAWGVLIFYDQNKNELRSAGLDRALWTNDDLIVKF